ncbi:hypothetical protein BDV93DRAFT_565516 [Ceratobasidium sp. AG-I]|nr:hypothetical protein BDV93DRAFT_565516 [Ceratobasidium sp. AG-I]
MTPPQHSSPLARDMSWSSLNSAPSSRSTLSSLDSAPSSRPSHSYVSSPLHHQLFEQPSKETSQPLDREGTAESLPGHSQAVATSSKRRKTSRHNFPRLSDAFISLPRSSANNELDYSSLESESEESDGPDLSATSPQVHTPIVPSTPLGQTSVLSSGSCRKARPPVGSPVWHHMQRIRLEDKQPSTPSPASRNNSAVRYHSLQEMRMADTVAVTPTRTNNNVDQSLEGTRSSRRERPIPGSPLWNHIQAKRASIQQAYLSPGNRASTRVQGLANTPASIAAQSPPLSRSSLSTVSQEVRSDGSPGISPRGTVSSRSSLSTIGERADFASPRILPANFMQLADRKTGPASDLRTPPLRVSTQLDWLERYVRRLPNLAIPPNIDTLDHLLSQPGGYSLYQPIVAICLMHAVYRPNDPDKLVLFLDCSPKSTSAPPPQDILSQGPPTHIFGLLHMKAERYTSLLVWGTCELEADALLTLRIGLADSCGLFKAGDDIKPYISAIREVIIGHFAPTYRINTITWVPCLWNDQSSGLSDRERRMLFCQMISRVVHEMPTDRQTVAMGPPLGPCQPEDMVEHQVRALLAQFVSGELCLEDILDGNNSVPECIYIHGDHLAFGNEEAPEFEDLGWWQEDAQEPPPETARLVNPATTNASLDPLGEGTWFLTVSDTINFRASTPTEFSRLSTPEHPELDTPADVHMAQHEDGLVESIQAQVFEHRIYQHPARVVYWQQLKKSEPSFECISLISIHLWLSSLLAGQKLNSNVLYLDPALVRLMGNYYLQDPVSFTAKELPELYDRQKLWLGFGPAVHVVAFMEVYHVFGHGKQGWVLLDFVVKDGHISAMDVLLPPTDVFDADCLGSTIGTLLAALDWVLPRSRLVTRSSKVAQRLNSLVLPEQHTTEEVTLAMLTHLCGKLLGQPVLSVDTKVMRQSICYYFNQALRSDHVDSSFPWAGLTDPQGLLLTEASAEKVRRHRFSLEINRQPSPIEKFPRRRSYTARLVEPGPSAPFFLGLAQSVPSHPPDMLVGTSGRSVEELEKAILLGPYPSWPLRFPDRSLQVPGALSLDEYTALIHSLGGPENQDSHILLLTGKHDGSRIKLDWLKDTAYPEKEWLMAGMDVDSLTLTSRDVPDILLAGCYYPYPNRGLTLTNRNELQVNVDGKTLDMHTCPNFCIMSFGSNNQFRLLVFFPGCRVMVSDRMWRNIPTDQEMQDWYHIFLTALRIVATQAPDQWQHAAEKTLEALPASYRAAANLSTKAGPSRSFFGYRIEPQILNHVFQVIRRIIDTRPDLVQYRGYFFHLCGINLKLATQNIRGREDSNPLNYAFRVNNFIDWYAQNPNDIVVDVGLALNLHRHSVPDDLRRSTLLFRLDPLRELLRPAYQKPQRDAYCHSEVIGGLRAVPLAGTRREAGVFKVQAYPKDMLLTYKHQDASIGANFTVDEALGVGNRSKFEAQMTAFREVMEEAGSYGVRLEFRLAAWGANRLMMMDCREFVERLVDAEIIVCYPTETVTAFKLALNRGWSAIINRQRQLPRLTAQSPEVRLLTSVMAYWLKGLSKKPSQMSASMEMAKDLYLLENVKDYGLPCLRSRALEDDGLRISYLLDAQSFRILRYCNVIYPGGNRIKHSNATEFRAIPLPDPLQSPPPTPPHQLNNKRLWSDSSKVFLDRLMKVHLPRALWDRFPEDHKTQSEVGNRLRGRPLHRTHWPKVVEPLNTTTVVKNKFLDAMDRLFPSNWASPVTTGDFGVYNREFLQRIRDHLASQPAERRAAYSVELRRRIRESLMNEWDYLPAAQAHKIWTFKRSVEGRREYHICPRLS